MKKLILLLFTTVFVLSNSGCKKQDSFEEDNINLSIQLNLNIDFSLELDNTTSKSSFSTLKTDSDFENVIDDELTITFTSEPDGYSNSLTFDPSDSQSTISLPYGNYNWKVESSIVSGTAISQKLPVYAQSSSTVLINQPDVDLDLVVQTDYSLITVNTEHVSSVLLKHNNDSINLDSKDSFFYGYVYSGSTSFTLEVTDKEGSTITTTLDSVESCKEYKYTLNYSDVSVNSLVCLCEPFEVVERFLTPNPSIEDHEGNSYKYVEICGKLWTTSFLKTTTYKNGTFINNPLYTTYLVEECITRGNCSCELTAPFDDVVDNQIPTYVYPSTFGGHFQMIDYKDKWGLHYNKWVVDNISDIIPEGWEIPSSQDFIDMFECLGATELTNSSTRKWNGLDGLRSSSVVDGDEFSSISGECNQYYTGEPGWLSGKEGTNEHKLNLIPSGQSFRSNIGFPKLIGGHKAVILTSDKKTIVFPGDNQYYDADLELDMNDNEFASLILIKR